MAMQIRRTATPNNPPSDLVPGQLAIEMANDPPRLWVGVPSDIDPSEQRVVVGLGGGGAFQTGDVKLTLRSSAEPGWVPCNDGTIGSSASGASTRANADCQPLFTLLFDNVSDAAAQLFTNTGTATTRAAQGTAANAWGNDCRIALTRMLGRALGIAGQGAGLSNQLLGSFGGADGTAITVGQLGSHPHRNMPANFASINDGGGVVAWLSNAAHVIWSYRHATGAAGGGAPHSNMQPTVFLNALMCL